MPLSRPCCGKSHSEVIFFSMELISMKLYALEDWSVTRLQYEYSGNLSYKSEIKQGLCYCGSDFINILKSVTKIRMPNLKIFLNS